VRLLDSHMIIFFVLNLDQPVADLDTHQFGGMNYRSC
jgi:hypothetical protein